MNGPPKGANQAHKESYLIGVRNQQRTAGPTAGAATGHTKDSFVTW